jgi:3-hydroxyisobutyrate dehydrogenase
MGEKVAFIGLGAMGYPMAGHLARAGHEVTVYNRTQAKADTWIGEHNGTCAATPAVAADGAQVVFSCVGADEDLRQVTSGENGAFETMKSGAVLIDHTTTSAGTAREVGHEAAARGFAFLDAPIAGGVPAASNGTLAIMVGGDAEALDRTVPTMQAYASRVVHMGSIGAGQLTKMVNQICATGIIQSLAEAINFAAAAGLDGEKVLDVISRGSAASWQMESRGGPMLRKEYNAPGTVALLYKDLAICLAEARSMGIELPVAKMVEGFYGEIAGGGGGSSDAAILIQRLATKKGA